MAAKSTRPAGLGPAGAALWDQITAANKLPAHKLSILKDACEFEDEIAEMKADQAGRPRVVRGSQGQDVIAPLVSELRQYRMAKAAMLGKLDLPDETPAAKEKSAKRSESARAAARARWGSAGVSA